MKITVLTLFPNLFRNFINESIIERILVKKIVKLEIVDFRQFSRNRTKRVDDYQYGGGAGMVITLQPIVDAIRKFKTKNSRIILLSPQGKQYTQSTAQQLAKYEHIILIAGRYEGFDERIINYVDEVISIGDYVLTGGEVPAMVIIETVSRLLVNAINHKSLEVESFDNNLLDYPVYTKPINFEGYSVPSVLLSGNHRLINEYRIKQRISKTRQNRKDLYNLYMKENKYGKN